MLVTLAQALAHLRVDGVDDADDITLKLLAAERIAAQFLDRPVFASHSALDAAVAGGALLDQPLVADELVKSAILLILGHLYASREDGGELPVAARALLRTYRRMGA